MYSTSQTLYSSQEKRIREENPQLKSARRLSISSRLYNVAGYGGKRLQFPENDLKQTTTGPSLLFSENPFVSSRISYQNSAVVSSVPFKFHRNDSKPRCSFPSGGPKPRPKRFKCPDGPKTPPMHYRLQAENNPVRVEPDSTIRSDTDSVSLRLIDRFVKASSSRHSNNGDVSSSGIPYHESETESLMEVNLNNIIEPEDLKIEIPMTTKSLRNLKHSIKANRKELLRKEIRYYIDKGVNDNFDEDLLERLRRSKFSLSTTRGISRTDDNKNGLKTPPPPPTGSPPNHLLQPLLKALLIRQNSFFPLNHKF